MHSCLVVFLNIWIFWQICIFNWSWLLQFIVVKLKPCIFNWSWLLQFKYIPQQVSRASRSNFVFEKNQEICSLIFNIYGLVNVSWDADGPHCCFNTHTISNCWKQHALFPESLIQRRLHDDFFILNIYNNFLLPVEDNIFPICIIFANSIY